MVQLVYIYYYIISVLFGEKMNYAMMHIPKCAGTSLLSIFRQWFPRDVGNTNWPAPKDFHKYFILSGHFPYTHNQSKWICFIRHPLIRLESFYDYVQLGKERNSWYRRVLGGLSLDEWMESPFSKNLMIKQFAGKSSSESFQESDYQLALDNAKTFWFIGQQERFTNDVRGLRNKFEEDGFQLNRPSIPRLLQTKSVRQINPSYAKYHQLELEFYEELLGIASK